MQSFIHLLASADMYEIEGIIATTGYSIGDNTDLKAYIFHDIIDLYERDLPNLMKRSGQTGFVSDESRQEIGYWPSPNYLRSLVKDGIRGRGMDNVGDGRATAGTNHIIEVVDRNDERPVWVQLWGGGNTLAQAIWDVRRTRSSAQLDTFLRKMRIYAITDQDRRYTGEGLENSSQRWMRQTFTGDSFFYIWSYNSWGTYGSTIKNSYWSRYTNEIQGKANLGSKYPTWKYIVEGDSPSYLHSWPGLNDPSDPTQYGFGGRFVRGTAEDGTTCWLDRSGDARTRSNNAITSTLPDQINDFVSRLNWAQNGSGNRNPRVVINGDDGYNPVVVSVSPGGRATLSASGSRDPDGNSISYSWTHDSGAGYSSSVSISGTNGETATVSVPSGAVGQDIHVVLRAVDNGSPNLASYRRAIIRVSTTSMTSMITSSTSSAPAVTTTAGANCAAKYGQCGGNGWTGATCCAAGSTCVFTNEWYSQCL